MTTPQSGREAFEAWWGAPLHRTEDGSGYTDRETHAAWRAWQAALAQQGQDAGGRTCCDRAYKDGYDTGAMHAAPKQQAVEVRLWDPQWVNVVNAPEVMNASDAEEAVRIAVRMTERLIAKNVADANLPPAALLAALPGKTEVE